MNLSINSDKNTLTLESSSGTQVMELYSAQSFEILSQLWLKVGWDQKYSYAFTWMGRPVIQMPEDMIRIQEVMYQVKPDVILETGVAHGGSLIFYASLCKTMEKGRVIGVDVEIRPHNRRAIEAHELSSFITLIEGDAVAPATVNQVKGLIQPGEQVLVILDSCHQKLHVQKELEAYHGLVKPDSYIIATDGIMEALHDVPNGKPNWITDNPSAAAREFALGHPEFRLEKPAWCFNESRLTQNVTYWPDAYLRRL